MVDCFNKDLPPAILQPFKIWYVELQGGYPKIDVILCLCVFSYDCEISGWGVAGRLVFKLVEWPWPWVMVETETLLHKEEISLDRALCVRLYFSCEIVRITQLRGGITWVVTREEAGDR